AVFVTDAARRRPRRSRVSHNRPLGRVRSDVRRRHDRSSRKNGVPAMTALDIGVYVPQMGFSYQDVLHRAQRCEELGIGSLWLYDHLYGPGMPDVPSLEAW